MSKRPEMQSLLSDLRYQLMHGVHTYSQCSREGCECMARGGNTCAHCLEDDIDRLINNEGWGSLMHRKYRDVLMLEGEALEMAEEVE